MHHYYLRKSKIVLYNDCYKFNIYNSFALIKIQFIISTPTLYKYLKFKLIVIKFRKFNLMWRVLLKNLKIF